MKMKICTLGIIFAIVFSPVWVWAKPIDRTTAQQVAVMQVQAQSQLRSDQVPELKLVYVATASADDKSLQAPANPNSPGDTRATPLYYVFNVGEKKGFVIVSGDDYIYPVIGHSSEGYHDPDNLPPALEAWLEDTKNGILSAREKNLQAPEKVKLMWENYLSGNSVELKSTQSVSSFIQTRWNQGYGNSPDHFIYNMLLPQVNGLYCVTGCVATTIAQVLKYYAYPPNGQGRDVTEAYISTKHGLSIPAINMGAETYDWSNMVNNYATEPSDDNQKNQVARLMYHVGASVGMDYSPEGSGASTYRAAQSMVKHFDYDKSIIQKDKAYYTDDEWRAILMNEMDNGRPVIYSGTSASGGAHAFLCDGYQSPTSFHFNLGWGGLSDGFYTINSLEYNTFNDIVLNVKPNIGGKEAYEIISFNNGAFSSNYAQVNIGESFSAYSDYLNYGFFDFTGELAIALYDQADQLVEVIGKWSGITLPSLSGYPSLPISCNVSSSVPAGNYIIKPIAISCSEDTIPVRYPVGAVGALPLTVIVPVQGVTLDKTELGLSIGNSTQLNPIFTPAFPTNTNVDWSSSNEAVATVENGLVTAVSNGTAIITVMTEDGNKTGSCKVLVRNSSTVTLNPVSGTIEGLLVLTEVSSGSGVDLPEAVPCNEQWIFAGWSTAPINEPTEPENESAVGAGLIPAGLYVPLEEALTLYAVYKKYEHRGIKEKVAVFTDFNGSIPGWSVPGVYYPTAGIDGSKCWTLGNIGDAIVTPSIEDPSRITFFVRQVNSYNGIMRFSVEFCKKGSDAWTKAGTYSSENNGITFSWKSKECNFNSFNLTGEYKIRLILDYVETGYEYNLVLDDVTVYSNYEDKGYSFASVISGCAPVTLAWQGNGNTDWNNSANWPGGRIPSATDIVTISGTALNFPVLTQAVSVGEIHFEPGAQIGGQHHLTGKAFVQYDLSRRNRWLMLSVPLQQVYPGDFTFGGHPLSWVRAFQATESAGITKGSWVTQRGSTTAFVPGDGFVLWLDPDDDHPTRGLKQLNGILELPFFHHQHPESLAKNLHEAVHHAHDYDHVQGLSTFHKVEHDGTEYVRVTDDNYSVPREELAYRLAGETVSKNLYFGENAEAGGKVALVGNPFMAALDFGQLYAANSESIKNSYHVWTGVGYESYTEDGSFGVVVNDPLTSRIAPLQSFLVEKPENVTGGSTLNFNASMSDANPARLRASVVETNKLNIIARNTAASVLAYIAKREGGRSDYGDLDVRKLINGFGNVPEVYTVKPNGDGFIAVGANIIESDNELIPIGLATSYTGEMSLSFTGMENYDARLCLIDAAENREIDLTGLSAYEYIFTYTPPKENGTTAACENRFFIRISKTPTSLAEVSAIDPINVYSSEGLIRVVSGPENRIREVLIHDLQGSLLHATGRLDAVACSIEKKFPAGVYIVRVIAEKSAQNVKLIIR